MNVRKKLSISAAASDEGEAHHRERSSVARRNKIFTCLPSSASSPPLHSSITPHHRELQQIGMALLQVKALAPRGRDTMAALRGCHLPGPPPFAWRGQGCQARLRSWRGVAEPLLPWLARNMHIQLNINSNE
eukprot:2537119-Pleurochrysis_carterae.AAC.2